MYGGWKKKETHTSYKQDKGFYVGYSDKERTDLGIVIKFLHYSILESVVYNSSTNKGCMRRFPIL